MTARNGKMDDRRNLLVLALVLGLSWGCASTWSLRTSQPEAALQWPFAPKKPKVTYVRSLAGFTQDLDTGAVFRAVVFGGSDEEANSFVLPVAVATGSDGRIAVADMGRRCVHLYIPAQRRYLRLTAAEGEKIVSPVGVSFDEEARLYVTDSSGKLFAFGGDGSPVFVVGSVGGEKLQRPTGVAYSPRSKLIYVVDTLANRVHALRTSGELAFSFGQRGEQEGSFNFPTHIFRSTAGELYVSDALNFRIEIFDEQGNARGAFGHHGDGSGDLALPKGVAVDSDGVVYVVDGVFDNMQLFNREGDFLLTVGQRGTDFGEFWLPSGAFMSADSELYVCDTYNRRVQVFRIAEHYADATS